MTIKNVTMLQPETNPEKKLADLKAEIPLLLSVINEKVKKVGTKEEINWGHTGSLEYVKNQLTTINKFLKWQ